MFITEMVIQEIAENCVSMLGQAPSHMFSQ